MKHIHLIAFDIPYPPDYGGVIDIYHKIKAFHQKGIKVHLHCFQYCREPSAELSKICERVYYYRRQLSKAYLLNRKPFIVLSRTSDELIQNICRNNYPLLFEGLHCCYYLNDERIKKRLKIVRVHNVEHNYYRNLANVEKDIFRKYYFHKESDKLRRFEKILFEADGIAAISKNDFAYFAGKYGKTRLVSAFHPNEKVNISEGKGKYALYHGSLDVGENNEAAMFLVKNIFNNSDIPLIIAGNKPSNELIKAVTNTNGNIKLKDNITVPEIYNLVENAHINILPTFQATGIKLKLLAALYNGRHCIANTYMVGNTGLETVCTVIDKPEDMRREVKRLFNIPYTKTDIAKREEILNKGRFSNMYNIEQLITMLFP